MKKFWKFSVCALAATFTLSSVTACGDKGETEEKSNITADQVLALGDSIQSALTDVQTFDFGVSMKIGMDMSGYYKTETAMKITAAANINGEDIDAKLFGEMSEKAVYPSAPDYNEEYSFAATSYILDGFLYQQDEGDVTGKTYIKSSRPVIDSLLEELSEGVQIDFSMMLEEIMGGTVAEDFIGLEIPDEFIKEVLNDQFILIQSGDTTRITFNPKKKLNEIFAYFGNLSLNTKVGDVVNWALGYVEEDLEWQDFTALFKGKGGYTLSTIVNVVDNELYNAAGMHLQDIKDMIFAEPSVYEALVQEMGKDGADMFANTTVNEFLAEYGALTLDDVVKTIAESETVTLDSIVTILEEGFAQQTIGGMLEMEDVLAFNEMVAVFKGIYVDQLNANLSFTVKNDKITRVEASFNMGVSVTAQGERMSVFANCSAYAENFSGEAKAITLPTGVTVKRYCEYCGLTAAESDYCNSCRMYVCDDCHAGTVHNG